LRLAAGGTKAGEAGKLMKSRIPRKHLLAKRIARLFLPFSLPLTFSCLPRELRIKLLRIPWACPRSEIHIAAAKLPITAFNVNALHVRARARGVDETSTRLRGAGRRQLNWRMVIGLSATVFPNSRTLLCAARFSPPPCHPPSRRRAKQWTTLGESRQACIP
jgi:hypothetical protein